MAQKKDRSRRVPRQERSRVTTEAIVEAAARVFAECGLEGATTNRIAEVAGVSVGSLYQYFPNKEALVTAIYERESVRSHEVLLRAVAAVGTEDLRALIRRFIADTVRSYDENSALYMVLMDELPRVAGMQQTWQSEEMAIAALKGLLQVMKDRIRPRNLDVAARALVWTFRYNTLSLLRHPMEDADRELFMDELADLFVRYLLAPDAD